MANYGQNYSGGTCYYNRKEVPELIINAILVIKFAENNRQRGFVAPTITEDTFKIQDARKRRSGCMRCI